jgi:hypothetical protein
MSCGKPEIVRRVEGLFALVGQLERPLAKAPGQVGQLSPSLLARDFAGKLVTQNPNDEPAVKLLERIKASHESKPNRDARKQPSDSSPGCWRTTTQVPLGTAQGVGYIQRFLSPLLRLAVITFATTVATVGYGHSSLTGHRKERTNHL